MKIKSKKLAVSITPHNITLYRIRPIDTSHHMSNGIDGTREIFLGHFSDWSTILESNVARALDEESVSFLSELREIFLMTDIFDVGTRCNELEKIGRYKFDNEKVETDNFRFRFFRGQVLTYFKKNNPEELTEEEMEDVEMTPSKAMPMIGAFTFFHRLSQSTAMYFLAKKYQGSLIELSELSAELECIKKELRFLSLK